MALLKRMDAHLDTLTTELYQVNTRVGHIARQQAHLGGFIVSPSHSLEASKDDGGASGGTSYGDEASSSSSDGEMIASQ